MSPPRIRLLDADPDLGRFLSSDERAEAHQLSVPLLAFAREDEHLVERRLEEHGAFAALLLEGMVLEQFQVGDQTGLRLLGPGDIVTPDVDPNPPLADDPVLRAIAGARLALLGPELLVGSHHWPSLVRGVHLRAAEQAQRLATQMVVCQLPRVDQRLLALMWLLAGSWGRVTPSGTTLPVRLTHDVLGALIGARRPTVTLALRDLIEGGAIARQDKGWLLIQPPPEASEPPEGTYSPQLIDDSSNEWLGAPVTDTRALAAFSELRERLNSLRERHVADRSLFDERMRTIAGVRERCQESRARVARDRVTRLRTRSS